MIAWLLTLGMALAGEPRDLSDTALLQVESYLDLGELGRAVAMARRGTRKRPDDVAWHLARLRTLDRAGMSSWIAAEYADRRGVPEAGKVAWAAWRIGRGEEVGYAPDHPAVQLARAQVQLAGDGGAAAAVAGRLQHAGSAWIRDEAVEVELAGLAASDPQRFTVRAAEELARGTVLRSLAPLSTLPVKGALKRLRKAAEARLDDLATSGSAHEVLDAGLLALAWADKARLAALAARAAALSADGSDLQVVSDALMAGPDTWSVWQLPARPRWNGTMLRAAGTALARSGQSDAPWTRRDEREALVGAWVAALEARGEVREAVRVATVYGTLCTPSGAALMAVTAGDLRAARVAAERGLLGCIGLLDLDPGVDPAGLDVVSELERTAGAWTRFATVAGAAGWDEDAGLAAQIALHLSPSEARKALALELGGPSGLGDLLTALADPGWLTPPGALEAGWARRGKVRTAALLSAEPRWLAARATPMRLCLPTMRARCMLEHAAAAAAGKKAREPLAEGVETVRDRGALRGAESWTQQLEAAWFEGRAALARLEQVPTTNLSRVAESRSPRVGMPAPAWRAGELSSDGLLGSVVVLSFWASWCGPCMAEWPSLDGLAARWADRGVRVVAVNLDEQEADYTGRRAILPTSAMQVLRSLELKRRFEVSDLPTVAVIDADGVLRALHVGYEGDLAWLEAALIQSTVSER